MTLPTLSVAVDWNGDADFTDTYDDISADVYAVTIRDALNERGVATVQVRNSGHKYDPDNSGGVLYGSLKPGRRIWIKATYSAVTYALFYGVIRRIVPHPNPDDQTAELVCEDPTCEWDLRDANVEMADDRSLYTFRTALLDLVDPTVIYGRSLAHGVEDVIPGLTGADGKSGSALDYLTEIDEATGSLSYIVPATGSTFYTYTVVDRATLEAQASAETWDAETAAGAITGLTNLDLSDESVINSQMVTASPPVLASSARVWTSDVIPFTVAASTSRTFWADYSGPVLGATVAYTATNSPTVTLTSFYETAKIVVTAGVSATTVTDLGVVGQLATTVSSSATAEDATSQANPPTGYGYRRGSPISSPWLASFAYAEGLAQHIVWRYKDPRVRPDITRLNVFPSILQRHPGEIITFTSTRASLSSKRLLIVSRDLTLTGASKTWEATYTTEELPAALNLFTVGGSADQGVGGTGILGY